MNLAEAAIRYKTITWVMTVLIVAGGVVSFQGLGRLEDPEFTVKAAQVFTLYPGASAMEVAEEVTDRVEKAIQELGEVDYVKSLSEPGKSTITLELKRNVPAEHIPQVWDELRRKVNDVQSQLPPGTSSSLVFDDYGDVYGVFYAVSGDGYTYAELKQYVDMLRRELLLCQDVAKVMTYGELPECVYVEISRERLAQLGLPPQAVYASVSGENLEIPAGRVQIGRRYVRLEPTGEYDSYEEIGETLILHDSGESPSLYLKDIATITRGYKDPPDNLIRFNGRPAIGVGISTVEGGNVITMGESLDARLAELLEETPIGIEIDVISHQADSVETAVNGFMVNLLEAVAIVIGTLMIAMGLRSGVLIGAVLVLTILGTFIVMDAQGIMLERISLGALIIALGMLVDNAIVVIDGLLINAQKGMDKVQAAAKIVGQTLWPLLGATAIAILAFAPIGASPDSTGEFCRSLFQVILISLSLSWVLGITVTPLLGVTFLKVKPQTADTADPYGGAFYRVYKKFLVSCLRFRIVVVVVLVLLLAAGIYGFGHVDKSFFPDSTTPLFMVHYWLGQGTHIRETEADLKDIEQYVLEQEGATGLTTFVGQGPLRFILTLQPEDRNPAYGMLLVSVEDYEQIGALTEQILGYIGEQFPGAHAYARRFMLGPGDPFKIQARLRGPDPAVLRTLAEQVREIAERDPETVDLVNDWRQRIPMLRPVVAKAQARNAGITRADIARAMEMAYEGTTMGVYREGDLLLPIIARAPERERSDIENLAAAQVFSPVAGQPIPLGQVVLGMETVSEESIVYRRNRLPTVTVKWDAKSIPASALHDRLRSDIGAIPLPPGYSLEWGGEYEKSGKSRSGLMAMLPTVAMVMVLIIIFLFNSIRKPLVIILTVPLAVIGVTAGLLIFDQPFGFMALLGFLSLSGMIIKNSVVLIDEINAGLAAGKSQYEAVVASGVSRVRPVSMAALTTILGMIPLIPDIFFAAMAVTIMCGLAFATLLTLIFVPILYACLFGVRAPAR